MHEDSYDEASDKFHAAFSHSVMCKVLNCKECEHRSAEELEARIDLARRRARIAELRAEIAAL